MLGEYWLLNVIVILVKLVKFARTGASRGLREQAERHVEGRRRIGDQHVSKRRIASRTAGARAGDRDRDTQLHSGIVDALEVQDEFAATGAEIDADAGAAAEAVVVDQLAGRSVVGMLPAVLQRVARRSRSPSCATTC